MSDEKRQAAYESWRQSKASQGYYYQDSPIAKEAFLAGYDAARAAEPDGLRETLQDFADFGTRHDLIPTLLNGTPGDRGWYSYISQMDTYVRNRARRALGVADKEPGE